MSLRPRTPSTPGPDSPLALLVSAAPVIVPPNGGRIDLTDVTAHVRALPEAVAADAWGRGDLSRLALVSRARASLTRRSFIASALAAGVEAIL